MHRQTSMFDHGNMHPSHRFATGGDILINESAVCPIGRMCDVATRAAGCLEHSCMLPCWAMQSSHVGYLAGQSMYQACWPKPVWYHHAGQAVEHGTVPGKAVTYGTVLGQSSYVCYHHAGQSSYAGYHAGVRQSCMDTVARQHVWILCRPEHVWIPWLGNMYGYRG